MAAKQAMRFAAGPILKSIRNILVPTNEAGKVAYGQLAARYAPDLLYSGLSAAMLPQGATGLERAGVAAEDLGIGLIGSLAGQLGGAGTARLASRMAGKKLGQEGADLAATMGDLLVGAPVNMFAPRPVFEGALNRITEEEYKNAQAQEAAAAKAAQEMTQQQAEQELISILLGAGAIGGRAIS